MKKTEFIVRYTRRDCDICGSADLESAWTVEDALLTKHYRFSFSNDIVICRKCGFCFVSPVADQEDLNKYYADSFVRYKNQPVNFDIETRSALIARYATGNDSYLEIGSHDAPNLYSSLQNHFKVVKTVEMAQDCKSDYKSIDQVKSDSFDVIAHFNTLEHFASPTNFLADCYRMLKDNGTMITEVPEIRLVVKYPIHMEIPLHMSHFSVNSITSLANMAGFALLDIDSISVGNAGGIILVFRKTKNFEVQPINPNIEYTVAKACVRECRKYMEMLDHHIQLVANKVNLYSRSGKTVTLWCANQMLDRLIRHIDMNDKVLIVDDDIKKEQFFDRYTVFRPDAVPYHIKNSDLVVISTHFYKETIKKRLKDIAGDRTNSIEIEIIDWTLDCQ